jgi:hypothetical protein
LETGLNAQLKLTNLLIIQPEVTYEMYGSKSDSGNVRMHAISPKINILLTTPNNKADMPFTYLLLGGYYRYNFAGKVGRKDADFTNSYAKDDLGLTFGWGFQMTKYQIGAVWNYGINSTLQKYPNGKVLNRSVYVTFAYFF